VKIKKEPHNGRQEANILNKLPSIKIYKTKMQEKRLVFLLFTNMSLKEHLSLLPITHEH